MAEELADLANYARFLYIRLRIMEEQAREGGIDLTSSLTGEIQQPDELPDGAPTFTPKSEVSGFLPKQG